MFGRKKGSIWKSESYVQIVVSPTSTYVAPGDQRNVECPECHAPLAKVPGAKTKCPTYGQYMYVRVDPRINARVIVAEADLDAMEDEIAKANGTWPERLREKEHVAEVTKRLTKQFGFAPSANDVQWGVFQDDQLAAAVDKNGARFGTCTCRWATSSARS
ncbi:MAG: hypothetical protein JWQ39_2175 [Glaciihabitans sp.]|nr:hypothetical protein [Glaciihabitans sp.]